MDMFCHDRFPILPIDQKVYFCNCSAELKYVKTLTIAPVKLLNINPTIKIDMVSRRLCDTINIITKTNKLPKQEAKIIPYEDNKN